MRRFLSASSAALLLGALLIGASACDNSGLSGSSETAQAASHPDARPAPDFTLKDADGRTVKLSDYKGKVVLLNFWATWCGPCKIEMPWFVDFQRKYKDRGFTVLAVSLDEDGWDAIRPFADEFKLNFPIVLGDEETAEKFDGIVALPTTLIIDRQGNIVKRHTGLVSKGDYEDEIEQLL